jgi:hypothetical protein
VNQNLDSDVLDPIYDWLADLALQIFRHDFNRIGGMALMP